jgi:Zn-dependent protease
MLLDLLTANDPKQLIISILLTVPIVMISLSVHEAAHAYIAYKMGDPTARNLGRLTINPMKHLDLVGSLMMLFVGYGWAKPVPINTRYFKNPKKGMALTALAGPLSNLMLAFIGLVGYVGTCFLQIELGSTSIYFWVVELFFYFFLYLNVLYAVFNMIPLPPFDGSRVLFVFLPDRAYFGIMRYERIILMVTLAIFVLGDIDVSPIVDFVINAMFNLVGLFL